MRLLVSYFASYLPSSIFIYSIVSLIFKSQIHRKRELSSLWHLIAIGAIASLSVITTIAFAAIYSDPAFLPGSPEQNLKSLFGIPLFYAVVFSGSFRALFSKE